MRTILTDEISQIECQLFKPFPPNLLLNDLGIKQAELFQDNTKMNLFLKNKSGSRAESMMAEAISSSAVTDTNIVVSLAMDMQTHGGPREVDIAQAMQMQSAHTQERITAFERGDAPADIIAREERAEISRLKEKVTLEQTMVVNQMDARYDAENELDQQEALTELMKETKGNLRGVFGELTGEKDYKYIDKKFDKGDIITGIKERRPDLDSKGILDAMGNFHVDSIVDNLMDSTVEHEEGGPVHRSRSRKAGAQSSTSTPTRKTPTTRKIPDPVGDRLDEVVEQVKRGGITGLLNYYSPVSKGKKIFKDRDEGREF